MFGLFEGIGKGCGCVLGVVITVAIIILIVWWFYFRSPDASPVASVPALPTTATAWIGTGPAGGSGLPTLRGEPQYRLRPGGRGNGWTL